MDDAATAAAADDALTSAEAADFDPSQIPVIERDPPEPLAEDADAIIAADAEARAVLLDAAIAKLVSLGLTDEQARAIAGT